MQFYEILTELHFKIILHCDFNILKLKLVYVVNQLAGQLTNQLTNQPINQLTN